MLLRNSRSTGLIMLVLFLTLVVTPALSRENSRVNVRLDTGEENLGLEFEYDLNYWLSISGGLGLTVLDTGNKGMVSLGFRYYLYEPGSRLYLKFRGLAGFDESIVRFRAGFGFGYATYIGDDRSNIELELLVGNTCGVLEIKPSIGISIGISR
ncbi:MAG TPA: hypothetical protein PK699_04575 [bacterium]|nr:hypothetical protein [bacterium]